MRKRLLTLSFCCVAVAMQMMAQGMKVVDFKLLENDLTANTRGTEKMDQNGERSALIKIQTPERGFTFDESTVRYAPDGRLKFIYIQEEISGFAIHLLLDEKQG